MRASFNRNDIGRHFLSRTALSGGYVPGLLAAVGLVSASGGAGAISPDTLPTGEQIVGGEIDISINGQTMTIQQALSRGVIDWQEFSIGGDASVIFDQLAGNDSITVNRVTGDDVSSILGDLQANGNVWLMNPNGVMFGESARVDVGGLVASTGSIDADAFLGGAGEIEIFGATDGSVVNEGEITVADGGIAAFVAPHVRNSGTITARMGVITLAGAEQATVDLYGDGLIEIAVADQAVSATNDGTLNADGGVIRMSAAAASGVVDSVVNMDGVVRANSVEQSDGRIVLNGGENGTVNVGADVMADGGTIDVEARDLVVSSEVGSPKGEAAADMEVNLVLGNDIEAGRLEITESGFLRVADLSLDSRFRSGGQAAGIVIDNARADGLHGQRLSLNTRYELLEHGFNSSDEVHVTSDESTINNAFDAIASDGRIEVTAENYYEKDDFVVSNTGVSLILRDDTTIDGGFVVGSAGDGFTLSGGTVKNGLSSSAAGSPANRGIYIHGDADVTIDGTRFQGDVSVDGQQIGAEIAAGSSGTVLTVTDAEFEDWRTGIYVNPDASVDVSGTQFLGNLVGIGTAAPGSLGVTGSTFDNDLEGIGFTSGTRAGAVTIADNEFRGDGISIANDGIGLGIEEINGENMWLVADTQDIAAIVGSADSGDTIQVGAGSFDRVTIDRSLTLLGAGAGETTITGAGVNQGSAVRIENGVDNVRIGDAGRGFTLESGDGDLAAVHAVGNNEGVTVQGNIIEGGIDHAVLVGGGTTNFSLRDNAIAVDGPVSAVYINGETSVNNASDGVEITGNTFTGGDDAGLLLGVEASNAVIEGNNFAGEASFAQLELWGDGASVSGNNFGANGQAIRYEANDDLNLIGEGNIIAGVNTDDATLAQLFEIEDAIDHRLDNAAMTGFVRVRDGQIYVTESSESIQRGVDAAVDGDTVNVGDGVFNENVNITSNISLLSLNGRDHTSIVGSSDGGHNGTVHVSGGSEGVRIGAEGRGFTITGFAGNAPGIETAAVYFTDNHSGARIEGNNIVAAGDAGLMTVSGADVTDFEIVGNEFSGTTFLGDEPAGSGFGEQFSLPNVPRQLVVMGGGADLNGDTSNILFHNNLITGTAGGRNNSDQEQGNTLITIDAQNATITDNTFNGTTTGFGASLRTRGPHNTITGNTFLSGGLGAAVSHVFTGAAQPGTTVEDIFNNNTFDRSSVVVGGSYIDHSIGVGVYRAGDGDQVLVGAGAYEESVNIRNNDLTLMGSGIGDTIIEGGIRIESHIADGFNLDGVAISDMTINAAVGQIGLHAVSTEDGEYDTTDLALSDLEINANGTHALGLFDVNGVTLNNVSLNGTGSETGIEAIGVDGFEMTGGSITDMASGVNQLDVTGYEDNGELQFSDVSFNNNDTHLRTTLDPSANYLGNLVASNDFDLSAYVDRGSAIHSAIGSALGDAVDGDDVIVGAGTYEESFTINKSVSLSGGGRDETIIDASETSGRGMIILADNVSLSDFTLRGPGAGHSNLANTNYGMKIQASGDEESRLRNFSLSGVTVEGFNRAPIDLNGVVGATIDDVIADGLGTGGSGIQITDSADVTITNSTMTGNNWGSVAIYQTNRAFDQQTTNITIDDTNTFEDLQGVFTQTYETEGQTLPLQEFGTLNLTFATHTVQNPDHRDNGDEFTFYRSGVQDAVDFAVNLNPDERASSIVRGWNGTADTNQYFVGTAALAGGGTGAMSINTAIGASQNGSTINVRNGSYNEAVSVNANRSMVFGNATVNSLTSSAPMGIRGTVNASTGNIALGGPTTLTGATTLRAPNGDINLNGAVTGAGRNLTLTGSSARTTARLNANIGSPGSRIGTLTINNVNRITQADNASAFVTASNLDAAGDISLSFNTINALGSVNVRSGGNLSGGLASASGNVSAGAGGNTNVNVVTNGGSANVSGQNVSGSVSTGGGNATLSASQSVNANVNAGSGSIQATGGQSVSGTYSGGAATFNAPDVNGSVNIAGNVTITSASAALSGNVGSLTPTGPGVVNFNGNTFVSSGAGQPGVGVEGLQPQDIGSIVVVVSGDSGASQLLSLPEEQLFGMIATAAGPGAMDGVSRIIVARTSDNIASLLQGGNVVVLDLTGDGVDRILAGADDEEEESGQIL